MSWSVLVFLSTISLACSARYWCSSNEVTKICRNGLQEEYAYLADECNQPDVAMFLRDVCRSNENGVICGTLDTNEDIQQLYGVCNSSLAADSECSDECRSLLASICAEYGCCMTVVNSTTSSNFIRDDVAFGGTLWSRCRVATVTEECPPSPFAVPEGINHLRRRIPAEVHRECSLRQSTWTA